MAFIYPPTFRSRNSNNTGIERALGLELPEDEAANPFEQVLAGIESSLDTGPWGWHSSRPPGHTIPATPTSAGETVTPQGQVLLTPPVGYTPTHGQHDWSKVYRSPGFSRPPIPRRHSPFNPETYAQDDWGVAPSRTAWAPGAVPARYLTGPPGSRPTVSRRGRTTHSQSAPWQEPPASQATPQYVPYPSLAGPYTPEFSKQAMAAMDYAASLRGGSPSNQNVIDVNTGIDTADQVWANSLMPLMSNRAFNDVMMQSPELVKAFDEPGRSRDEGVYGMVGNAMQTMLAGAQQAALEDQMRRESENRLFQQQGFNLANQYGQALAGLMGQSYLQQLENSMAPQLMGLQWLTSILGE